MPKKSITHHHNKNKKINKRTSLRAETVQQFHNSIKIQTNEIKNKHKRQEVNEKRKKVINTLKKKQKRHRQELPQNQRQKPITIEDKTQPTLQHLNDYDEAEFDEFNQLLNDQAPVKVLITTCLKPATKIYAFLKQLMMVFHNIYYYPRDDMKLQDVYEYANNLKFTHVIVVRYSQGWQILIKHIEGIEATFKVTSLQYQKQIKHHALATDHIPQLILHHFDSKVGVRVGRLLASLFPQNPEFKGRRVVTFHNQRDFIFFRHHRYIFRQGYQGVNMQEIGPRFTLRLKSILGSTETDKRYLQFKASDNMYVDRKATYL